jgi:hypothetical protein
MLGAEIRHQLVYTLLLLGDTRSAIVCAGGIPTVGAQVRLAIDIDHLAAFGGARRGESAATGISSKLSSSYSHWSEQFVVHRHTCAAAKSTILLLNSEHACTLTL